MDINGAIYDNVIWREAQTGHLCVIAHLEVERNIGTEVPGLNSRA